MLYRQSREERFRKQENPRASGLTCVSDSSRRATLQQERSKGVFPIQAYRSRRGIIYLPMLCLIVKHWLLPDSYGPFDRGVEILVLAAITFEIARSLWRGRKKKRRLAALYMLIAKGKKIQADAPGYANSNKNSIAAWRKIYAAWVAETNAFLLKSFWPHASALFMEHDPNPPGYLNAAPPIQCEYAHLVSGLGRLSGIMEIPDGYF